MGRCLVLQCTNMIVVNYNYQNLIIPTSKEPNNDYYNNYEIE